MNAKSFKNLALVSELFIKNKLSVAVAESCTAGMIQNLISNAPEAMSFFQGGITVYNAGQKAKHLHINPIAAEKCNSVSKEIAEKLAQEVAMKFNSEIGISITGYAQPVPDKGIKTCFAYICICQDSKIMISKKINGIKDQVMFENQQLYAEKVLEELIKVLEKKSH